MKPMLIIFLYSAQAALLSNYQLEEIPNRLKPSMKPILEEDVEHSLKSNGDENYSLESVYGSSEEEVEDLNKGGQDKDSRAKGLNVTEARF